jgi:hypothetical protein
MDLADFKANVADATALLKALRTIIPAHVGERLIEYLELVQEQPVGLEILRNVLASKK